VLLSPGEKAKPVVVVVVVEMEREFSFWILVM
jgi:hypothetical protein